MFSFLADVGNYESRKVGRDNFPWGFVSTARVSDGAKPYETAVKHTDYNEGKMVIVDHYNTKKQAQTGHAKWLATMTATKLPKVLIDCANSKVQQICSAFGEKTVYNRKNQAT